MLFCDKCHVNVRGRPDFCPLCHGNLSGTAQGSDSFPTIIKKTSAFTFAVRIAAFISIVAVFVCSAINYSAVHSFYGWSLYVTGAIASFWLPFGMAVRLRGNVTKSIVFTAFVCCIVAFFWDLCTGYNGWALDIALPITCCAAMIAVFVIAKILGLRIEQYIYYLIIDIIFGIVPLILLLCGVVRSVYLSVACVALSAIFLAALLLFYGRALRAEIVRRTHL